VEKFLMLLNSTRLHPRDKTIGNLENESPSVNSGRLPKFVRWWASGGKLGSTCSWKVFKERWYFHRDPKKIVVHDGCGYWCMWIAMSRARSFKSRTNYEA